MKGNGSSRNFDLILAPWGEEFRHEPSAGAWIEPMEGAALLNAVAESFSTHMALPAGASDALALWIAHAHCVPAFLHSPRLCFSSPEQGCGKTVGLDITTCLAPRAIYTESPTEAALCRAIHRFRPTMILDEYDNWLRSDRKLLSLLNAGHKQGAMRMRSNGGDGEIQFYNVFGAVALGGIGSLPGTLVDRSIVIHLLRAQPGEIKQPFDLRHAEKELALRQKLARWTRDVHERIRCCRPTMPDGANNRCADNWRPLVAIAEVAGGDWSRRASDAFDALNGSAAGSSRSPVSALLLDIRIIFQTRQAYKLASADLASELSALEGRPWAELGQKHQSISAHQVAFLLRPYGIVPRTIRLGTGTIKGYHLSDFTEAFLRFCPGPQASERNIV